MSTRWYALQNKWISLYIIKLLMIYYKQSLIFLSPRGGRVLWLPPSFLATRCFAAQRLRARALPSLTVWKKKDCLQYYSGAVLKTQFLVCVLYLVHDTQSVFFSVPVLCPVHLFYPDYFRSPHSAVKSSRQVNFYLNSHRIIINTNLCFKMV